MSCWKDFFALNRHLMLSNTEPLLKKKLRSRSVFVIHSQLLKANGKKKAALFQLPGSFTPLFKNLKSYLPPLDVLPSRNSKEVWTICVCLGGDTSGVTPISGDFRTTTPACLTSIDYSAQHLKSQQKWCCALHHHCRSVAGVHISPNSSSSFKHTASWGGNRTRPTLGC